MDVKVLKAGLFIAITLIIYGGATAPISMFEAIAYTSMFWMLLKWFLKLPEPFADIEIEDEEET